jgi:tetratricopeptide (TPR) repeat protein
MRHFLRLWLLDHRKQPEIMAINKRLKQAHEQVLHALEDRRQFNSLKEKLQDDDWVSAYLDLAEQQCWLDPVEGLRYLLPFMLAAAIYRREANEEADAIGTFFQDQISSPYRNWWTWASESLTYLTSRNPHPEELQGIEELIKLLEQKRPIFASLLANYRDELQAALWWRLGEAYQGRDDRKALELYEKALTKLDGEDELKEAAARTCFDIAYQLDEEKQYPEAISLLDKAIRLKPDFVFAYNIRGFAYYNLTQYEAAIADFTQAIALDPNDAKAYNNRGNAYLWAKRSKDAKNDYIRSYELNPTDINAPWMAEWAGMGKERVGIEMAARLEEIAGIAPEHYLGYVCRGVALGLRGKLKEGLAEIEKAIPIEPDQIDAYFWKGMLCAYYYRGSSAGKDNMAMEAIEKALNAGALGLPPVLLTPWYWLERDNRGFFERCANPLLEKYEV